MNTREGAKVFEATLRGRLSRGEAIDGPDPVDAPTFAEFSAEWFETYVKTNNKPSDQHSKRCTLDAHLLPAFGRLRLDQIEGRELEVYKAEKVRSGLSPKTVNNHLNILSACLRRAVEWNALARMPRVMRFKVVSRRSDFLTDDERVRLLDATRMDAQGQRMVALALDSGLRIGEILALRTQDIDLNRSRVTVSRAWVQGQMVTPKSGRERQVPLTRLLADILACTTEADGLLFPGEGGGPLSYWGARHVLERACDRAGIRRVSWHVLRHTFGTRLCSTGAVPSRTVQAYMGHASLATTERYVHVMPAIWEEAIHVLDHERTMSLVGNRWATPAPTDPPVTLSAEYTPNARPCRNG